MYAQERRSSHLGRHTLASSGYPDTGYGYASYTMVLQSRLNSPHIPKTNRLFAVSMAAPSLAWPKCPCPVVGSRPSRSDFPIIAPPNLHVLDPRSFSLKGLRNSQPSNSQSCILAVHSLILSDTADSQAQAPTYGYTPSSSAQISPICRSAACEP